MTTLLTDNLALLAGLPNGVDRLRVLIRDLAATGRLVPHEDDASAWQWSTLGSEISGMDAGWSPACLDTPASADEVWGVLRTTAVQPLRYVQAENKELPANLTPRPEAEVKAGDVLFTRAGPMNRVGISCLVDSTRPRLMLSDKIIRFRPNPQRLDGRFTALCLNAGATARYLEAAKSGMAASQVNISQAKLKAAPVPVPPLAEQHRIVAKVDELMALCDRLEAEQADADAAHAQLVEALLASLTQARDAADFRASWQQLAEHFHTLFTTEASVDSLIRAIHDLALRGVLEPQRAAAPHFQISLEPVAQLSRKLKVPPLTANEVPFAAPPGWTWQRLEAITSLLTDGEHLTPPRTSDVLQIPLATAKNVRDGFIDLTQTDFVERPVAEKCWKRCKPSRGDVLMVSVGATLGRVAVMADDREMVIVRSVALFRPVEVVPQFLALALRSELLQGQIWSRVKQSAQPCLYLSQAGQLAVPVPPAEEQHRIVAKVSELLRLCTQIKESLAGVRRHHEHLASVLVEQAVA